MLIAPRFQIQSVRDSGEIEIFTVRVDAIDLQAKKFYLKHEFMPCHDRDYRYFCHRETMIEGLDRTYAQTLSVWCGLRTLPLPIVSQTIFCVSPIGLTLIPDCKLCSLPKSPHCKPCGAASGY